MKRNRTSLSAYGVATILSLIAHVSCLAFLEGVMLLTGIRFDGPRQPRILFETRQFHTAERIPSGTSHVNVRYGQKSYRRSEVRIQSTQRHPAKKNHLMERAEWQGWLQSFVTNQADLDRRIVKIKDRLDTLGIDVEIPNMYVSDADPISRYGLDGLEVSRMRNYLAQMRSKIRSVWLKKVSSQNIRLGVATIEYRIDSSGAVSSLKTLSLEGNRSFNRSCVSAVEESSPFGPLSSDLDANRKDGFLTVKLTFYLRGFDRHENLTPVA